MAVDGVEEDWQLVMSTPEPDSESPQFGTSITTDNTNPSFFVLFFLNYRDEPTFQAGGLEVEAWNGSSLLAFATQGTALCQTDNEKISWTQRTSLSGSTVSYNILYGQSITWGQFGSSLTVSFTQSVGSLTNYSPDTSLFNSGVSYGANDVASFALKQVRYYQGLMLVSTDTSIRSKHQPPWF